MRPLCFSAFTDAGMEGGSVHLMLHKRVPCEPHLKSGDWNSKTIGLQTASGDRTLMSGSGNYEFN